MSELTDKLTAAGQKHKGTYLGGLLQWAVLHIQAQAEALYEAREELEAEQNERIRLERALHTAKASTEAALVSIKSGLPVNIELSKDLAPHINIMAHHGVEPYAKKPRKKKEAA